MAEAKLAQERPDHTLQATALVHEAYVRLVDQAEPQGWDNTRHFFSAAAEAMRRILIERARQRASIKRGGGRERIMLEAVEPVVLPLGTVPPAPGKSPVSTWPSRSPVPPSTSPS